MRIAVVGAGAVGSRTARHLLGAPGIEVLISDVRAERATQLAAALGSPAAVLDDDQRDGIDVAVLATPAGDHAAAARVWMRAGAGVVSTSDAVDDVRGLLDLDAEAQERGVGVLAGAAFSPGLSCLLAAHGASTFDEIDEVHVARVGTGGPACARQRHAALAGTSFDWRDGEWQRRQAGSGRELCWFPDPIGGRDCYRAALPDPLLLQRAFPSVERVTARLAANRRDRLTAQLPMLRRPHAEGGPGAVRVELRGRRGSARAVLVYGAMDFPASAAGGVAAHAALVLGRGGALRAGAGGLAELVDPLPILRDLAAGGVKAAAFDGG